LGINGILSSKIKQNINTMKQNFRDTIPAHNIADLVSPDLELSTIQHTLYPLKLKIKILKIDSEPDYSKRASLCQSLKIDLPTN
jgi:hypothetical protein